MASDVDPDDGAPDVVEGPVVLSDYIVDPVSRRVLDTVIRRRAADVFEARSHQGRGVDDHLAEHAVSPIGRAVVPALSVEGFDHPHALGPCRVPEEPCHVLR